MKKPFFILLLLFVYNVFNAQIFKNFGDKLEEKINKKLEEKVNRHVDKTLNKVDQKSDSSIDNIKSGKPSTSNNDKTNQKSRQIKGAKDYVSGTTILAAENFSQDALGDFPVNWLTNSSGEVSEISGTKSKWLMLNGKGTFTIKNFNKTLPKNFTFEFDVYASDGFSYYSTALNIGFVGVANLKKDYSKWSQYTHDKDGIIVNIHPTDATLKEGLTRFFIFDNGSTLSKNEKSQPFFTQKKNLIRVQFWRQESRLRMYIDNQKVWDLPDAFQDTNYNAIVFYLNDYHNNTNDSFYVSNLVLAQAGADTRHKLIETGSFTTNEILFDTNKATIKPSSENVLSELGNALKSYPDFKVLIIGHTDGDGDTNENQKLSEKRADSVKKYLVSKYNISPSQIQTDGKGETQPITDNKTEEGRSKNRRVEFKKIAL